MLSVKGKSYSVGVENAGLENVRIKNMATCVKWLN